jgi:hypothetical protein
LPYRLIEYRPTLFDWTLVGSSYFFMLFFYVALVKILPILEIPEQFMPERPVRPRRIPMHRRMTLGVLKRITACATVLIGVGLIAYGISTRHDYWTPSPAIWISGIIVLWTIPLQVCMIPGFPSAARRLRRATPGTLGLVRPQRNLVPSRVASDVPWQQRAA